MTPRCGMVYLVGAGPGDPELITVRGLKTLSRADVVVYDRLIDRDLLHRARADAELINVGKSRGELRLDQTQINRLLVDCARQGRCVVRLKGGDPFVFGRGFEELSACRDAGVDCVVIPGVSSAVAAPAAAGIPLTLRGVARSFAVLTAETAESDHEGAADFSAVEGIDTLVFLMSRARLPLITHALIAAGRGACTPVACIERAALPHQHVVTGTLADIAEIADREGLSAPMVAVVGEVARHAVTTPSPSLGEGWGEGEPANPIDNRQSTIGNWPLSPLAGKRIVITRPRSTARELVARLADAGAVPILCPMIRIVYPAKNDSLDAAIRRLGEYRWIVFTSIHGVKAFWRRLAVLGFDARRLGGCKVAAIGLATARELRRRGITPNAVSGAGNERSGPASEVLVDNMVAQSPSGLGRVLFPRGDLARTTIPAGLRSSGATVDDPIAYSTVDAAPPENALIRIRGGVDAVVFCSPSAVRRFVTLKLNLGDASVVCIGPTTAQAASDAGLRGDAVAAEHSNDGLIDALSRCFLAEAVP